MTQRFDCLQIDAVADTLKRGGLVAFPTDTVFGIGACSNLPNAIEKLKWAKGRSESKPFPLMVSSIQQIRTLAVVSASHERLINKLLPGALTIVFRKLPHVDPIITNGFDSIAIRMPNDPWIIKLIDIIGVPLLVSSANISGEPSCYSSNEVLKQMDGRIDGIVEGVSGDFLSSTIVDMCGDVPIIIRQGKVTIDDIMKALEEDK